MPAILPLGAGRGDYVPLAGVMGLHANALVWPGDTGGTAPRTLCIGVYGGNAPAGTRHRHSSSRPDGNGRGLIGLNQCSPIHAGCVSVLLRRKRSRGATAVVRLR